jgi:diguanylate cyclase (GGDEF)-like protein
MFGANLSSEEKTVSLRDAVALTDEIERLRAEVDRCHARIRELDRLAHYDSLVGLPNRRSFLANLERLIARVKRYGGPAAVVSIDADGLKAINDKFGHDAGDKALIEISSALKASVRDSDLVARLAGDEFGILLEQADELTAWQTALRVTETLDVWRFCVEGISLPLSAAVGVAAIRAEDTVESVLKRADKEMYRIKAI